MMNRIKMISAVAIAGGLLWALSAQQAAPISGQWIIDRIDVPGQVLLTLHRSFRKSGSSTNSSGFPASSLKGLSGAQMESVEGSRVRFEIVRDAGTLACEGYF